ncbi:MAG: DUF5989 family protein [archaeon]
MKKNIVIEVFEYIIENKVWWIAPIVIMLIIVGILVIFVQNSAVSPFVYILF